MKRKTWDEFRDTGLFCFVNSFLHMFGWAIVLEKDENNVEAYPARVDYTGFNESTYEKNYNKVRKLLNEEQQKEIAECDND